MAVKLTVTEKIFCRASGKSVKAGDFLLADIARAMTHDTTGPLAVQGFYEITKNQQVKNVWDPSKIAVLFDHWMPADSLEAAQSQSRRNL